MGTVPGLTASCPGLLSSSCPKLFLGNQRCGFMRNESFPRFRCPSRKILYLNTRHLCDKRAAVAARRGNQELSFDPDLSPEEPFWLALIKELIWSLKSMLSFLREQPSQLKYIEWPSFQSTLRTAMLTLVLVALLIVALTSVDMVLSYVSSWLLRKNS
ncbi:uncharacterized protein LOC116205036 isoform X1 [Punica granatum]|uniref:Uncharacterized protein LOC116205036 isoform X1 n=2 Tax=Punica granatum TaxID=22663 RepID=A0A6P8D8B5_PUNGR|nr:uncharacterized protein LOC116205036 isoform X1 [Punica granatum]PKI78667.1 hypothetical protein CRG98_000892 [Punica granatum]